MHTHEYKTVYQKGGLIIAYCDGCCDHIANFYGEEIDFDPCGFDLNTFDEKRFALEYEHKLAVHAQEAIRRRKTFRAAMRQCRLKLFR